MELQLNEVHAKSREHCEKAPSRDIFVYGVENEASESEI